MTGRARTTIVAKALVLTLMAAEIVGLSSHKMAAQSQARNELQSNAGQTATLLPDGRWLIVGGQGPLSGGAIWNPEAQLTTPTTGRLVTPRRDHTATVLDDGTVLIAGGRLGERFIDTAELFDPATGLFRTLPITGSTARALHSATLLTDGRVLIAGGTNGGRSPIDSEVWAVTGQTATAIAGASLDRAGHTAALMPDGRVLLTGGATSEGRRLRDASIVDVANQSIVTASQPDHEPEPAVAAILPADGAVSVPLDVRIAVRFSRATQIGSLTPDTVALRGPEGFVVARVIPAEEGRLAFLWPAAPLEPSSQYHVTIVGVVDGAGDAVSPATATFVTVARQPDTPDGSDGEEWVPSGKASEGWQTHRPPSPWESLAPLLAEPGVTALSGRVLTLDGRPLSDVSLQIEGVPGSTLTDRTGRFLLRLPGSTAARGVLQIDGKPASRPGKAYGFFEYGAAVATGQTTVLPFTIWMPRLDMRHYVTIPSPTRSEVVITTPNIPGLELHIPPNTVIRGEDGKPVRELGITAIPVDRPPFPLARNVNVPVYFTVQPGGAYVYTAGTGPKGAWLVYPNYRHGVSGQLVQFFHYDPDHLDWYVYGTGQVDTRAAQVFPAPRTRLYKFTGAMINCCGLSPDSVAPTPAGKLGADPVDPSTGVFVLHKTDLYLPDVIPIALTRTYNSGSNIARPFGVGMTHPYAMFLWSAQQYQEADLILPEGGKIHFVRTSAGTGYTDAVFEHKETVSTSATPTAFYRSTMVWNGNGWDLRRTDGTVFVFGENAPLQAIRDKYGNTVRIEHASGQTGNVTRVISPNGRWIAFSYSSDRITSVTDNIGRTFSYTYTTGGSLETATDAEGNVTTYTYDTSNRMLTIEDGRGNTYLTNQYTSGRITQQTLADSGQTFGISYTVNGSGTITQTDITNPRGYVERLTFNADHYVLTDTEAHGNALARTTTYERQTGSNLVTAVTDALNRRTEFTYDSSGAVLTVTPLAGTSDAVTTTFTYESAFHQVATVTDPLGHTWTSNYDNSGHPSGSTDPLSHSTTLTLNASGQVTAITDPLSHQWQFGYTGGDLTSTTDPLSAVATRFVDGGGRVQAVVDPLGRMSRMAYDKLNRLTSATNVLGGVTSFVYDGNSNVTSVTDARSNAIAYHYDASDRVDSRTDQLSHSETYGYDDNGNLTSHTDRKSQVTGYTYDALDRVTVVTFSDSSTIAYTYDAGDRILEIDDSANGTISREYDNLDRLTEETTSEGTVDYTYDDDGRRASMTVAGQTSVTYAYDNAHRLTSIAQGSTTVSFTYDNANRRSTVTYPSGVIATYGYDNANNVTTLLYTYSGSTLGDLAYTYDAARHRVSIGGTWARTGIPSALTSATYNAANRLTAWDSATFSYDLNGSLTGDGTNTYTWNARNQVTGITGGSSASYLVDGVGRRRSKTISGTTTRFLYDDQNFVQELSSGGTPTANLLTGLELDRVFRRVDTSVTRDLLGDPLGNIVALANTSGAVQTSYTFEPFGATTSTGSSSTNAQQFTARENDSNGLHWYRARLYSPQYQRFLSEDPAGFDGGLNLYQYVQDDPIVYTDPTGQWIFQVGGSATGAVGPLGGTVGVGGYIGWCDGGLGAGIYETDGSAVGAFAGAGISVGGNRNETLFFGDGAGIEVGARQVSASYGTGGSTFGVYGPALGVAGTNTFTRNLKGFGRCDRDPKMEPYKPPPPWPASLPPLPPLGPLPPNPLPRLLPGKGGPVRTPFWVPLKKQ